MSLKTFALWSAMLLIALLLFDCSKGTSPDENRFVLPDSNLSFYQHIEPLLEYRCAESGCHSSTDTDNKLLYIELVNKMELINHRLSSTGEHLIDISLHRSEPERAPFYRIISVGYPSSPQDLMPPYDRRLPLSENQIAGIRQWIAEGCPD